MFHLLQISMKYTMQICMKLNSKSRSKLKSDIRERFDASGLNYSEVGKTAHVHSSQVSRICRGEFRTVSFNVVQVCKVLGVDVETVKIKGPGQEPVAQRLANSLLDIWDRTPADAERLVRFLNDLAELRRSSKSDSP